MGVERPMSTNGQRHGTVAVKVGGVTVGGGAPIVVQSMTNTDTADVEGTARQVASLAAAGSELVRITVDRDEAAAAVPRIRERLGQLGVSVPLIGDFHYIGHQLLADHPGCAEALDKYRINPGNVGFKDKKDKQFSAIIDMALKHHKPVRIGANWGSLDQELLTRLMDRLSEHELTDVLYVGHGRWWSLTCGEECCPLAGTLYDLSSHPMSAAAVLAGLGVRANRRELEASISGPPEAELPRLVDAVEDLLAELEPFDSRAAAGELLVSIMDSAMADPSALDERNCLLLGLLVTDIYVRDSAWARIGRSDAEDHVRLWGSVVTRVPPVLAPAPLCLLGMAAWVSGHGALVNCCWERVSQVDPDYSMGKLLSDIGERGIPPSIWQEIKDDMQAELDADLPLLAG